MLKLENSIRGLSFSRVAFDLTIQGNKNCIHNLVSYIQLLYQSKKNILNFKFKITIYDLVYAFITSFIFR